MYYEDNKKEDATTIRITVSKGERTLIGFLHPNYSLDPFELAKVLTQEGFAVLLEKEPK